MDIPLLAIYFLPPADGLPLFHAWLVTAKDVWHRGYEGHREILEIRLNDRVDLVDHGFRSFIPTKGLGRVSCILWAVLWSYSTGIPWMEMPSRISSGLAWCL